MLIDGVKVTAPQELTNEEISSIVREELQAWSAKDERLGEVEISLDGQELVIQGKQLSPIRRVRRITGYLSDMDNFNDAKRAECLSRVVHDA